MSTPAFHTILVPLDGSTFAEHAIPLAAAVAERHAAALSLAVVHPWGPPEDAPFSGTAADHECRDAEQAYLARMTQAVHSAHHIPVSEAVLDGPAGPTLVAFARERGVDLVIASTHGRGAVARFVVGSVAHHLVRQVRACVLLIKPQEGPIERGSFGGFERILVATDGSASADAVLQPAAALASSQGAVVTLFQVVFPAASDRALEHHRAEAERHLAALAGRVTARGLGVTTATAVGANPAAAILVQAERRGADLIALTTRERGSVERTIFGSVADAVVHHANIPVLICHAR